MDCTRFEELLFEELEGRLEQRCAKDLRAHAAGCARCRRLQALMGVETEAVGPEFTATVLAMTSGAAARHRALDRLEGDLPLLAEMAPDDEFVADVMAATVEADRARLARRLGAFWRRLVQRPRFALESAYIGALLVLLLFGLPASPLAEVPESVAAELRNGGAIVRTTVAAGTDRAGELGRTTWRRAGDLLTTPIAHGNPGDATTIRTWRDAALRVLRDFWQTTLEPAIEWLRSAWLRITGRPAESELDLPSPRGTTDDRNLHPA